MPTVRMPRLTPPAAVMPGGVRRRSGGAATGIFAPFFQVWTAGTSGTITVPFGATKVTFVGHGAGAGGGYNGGIGGGGGSCGKSVFEDLTGTESWSFGLGQQGTGGVAVGDVNATDGGDVTLDAAIARGGTRGGPAGNAGSGRTGAGGIAEGWNVVNFKGGDGGDPAELGFAGGGGAAASPDGEGEDGGVAAGTASDTDWRSGGSAGGALLGSPGEGGTGGDDVGNAGVGGAPGSHPVSVQGIGLSPTAGGDGVDTVTAPLPGGNYGGGGAGARANAGNGADGGEPILVAMWE